MSDLSPDLLILATSIWDKLNNSSGLRRMQLEPTVGVRPMPCTYTLLSDDTAVGAFSVVGMVRNAMRRGKVPQRDVAASSLLLENWCPGWSRPSHCMNCDCRCKIFIVGICGLTNDSASIFNYEERADLCSTLDCSPVPRVRGREMKIQKHTADGIPQPSPIWVLVIQSRG